jgi:hypothetical protein
LKTEIAGLEAELATLRRNYNVLDTAHKRAQKKVATVEEENRLLKEKKTPKDADNRSESSAIPTETSATNVQPAVGVVPSTPVQSEGAESHAGHEMEWVPPYCGEHGCENTLFKREVECANCHGPIGSEEYAKHKLKACPLCGVNAGYKPVQGYTTKHDNCVGPDCKLAVK